VTFGTVGHPAEPGCLKHPLEWDDDTAASIASVEIATRDLGDGKVEYVRKIKLWERARRSSS
jgi:phage terminase small subunit